MALLFAGIYRALFPALCTLWSLSFPTYANMKSQPSTKPIYAIAYCVLHPVSATAALSHGTNSLEVNLVARESEWWAEHPGETKSGGIPARELFTLIVDECRNRQNTIFLWLDVKNPDRCKYSGEGCSVDSLKDLVRERLKPVGTKELYGPHQTQDIYWFTIMSESIKANEAISLNVAASDLTGAFEYTDMTARTRIIDYGQPHLDQDWGDCHEVIGRDCMCVNLRQESSGRDRRLLGKVIGWMSTKGDTERAMMLFLPAQVDGIIYGFQDRFYKADDVTRGTFCDISSYVEIHSTTHRVAIVDDAPW